MAESNEGVRRALFGAAVALATAVVASGCVDKAKCDEAISTTRDALTKNQPDIARQWRDRAWKICNDSTPTAPLDKEITEKEAAIAAQAAASAKALADGAQMRMNQATQIWKAFDKLDEKDRTVATLDQYKAKAARTTQDLPPEYAKQLEDYNDKQYQLRLTPAEAKK
jgi:hypothetical protein